MYLQFEQYEGTFSRIRNDAAAFIYLLPAVKTIVVHNHFRDT